MDKPKLHLFYESSKVKEGITFKRIQFITESSLYFDPGALEATKKWVGTKIVSPNRFQLEKCWQFGNGWACAPCAQSAPIPL